jgi:hypothetical protein
MPSEELSKPWVPRPARAELVWQGKYDAGGRRVAPLRIALPFQTVETVNRRRTARKPFSSAQAFARRVSGQAHSARST